MARYRWAVVAAGVVVLGAFLAGWWTSRPSSTQLSTGGAGAAGEAPVPAARGRVSAVVHVSEHQFLIQDIVMRDELTAEEAVRQLQEPPAPPPETVSVLTGISEGPVHVAVEALPGPPSGVELDPWEVVAEISFTATAELHVTELFGGGVEGLPVLNPAGPGSQRLRVHASGRDANYDGVDDEPNERYLVLVWPAPAAPEVVHKMTDGNGGGSRSGASDLVTVYRFDPQPSPPRERPAQSAPVQQPESVVTVYRR